MGRSKAGEQSVPHAAIVRAKREWQCVADELPQLVCLLNRNGEVVRANRVVERWMIGPIREGLGLELHPMLRLGCCAADCTMRRALERAWQELSGVGFGEFEMVDPLLAKAVKVELRLMPDAADVNADGSSTYAVCIISDVTQLRQAQEGQQQLNRELEIRVHERTQELSNAVRGLRAEITRRELAENSLRTSRNELSLLSEQLMKAQECERKRIAQDLLDAVGQSLSAIKYSLERAVQMMGSPQLGSPLSVLNKTVEHVQHTIDEVRTISDNLRPALLDGLGA